MKKLLSVLLLSSIGLMANDIQVITANSMQIKLDKGTQIKEVFFGTTERFKASKDVYKKAGGSILDGVIEVGNSGGSGAQGAAAGAVGVLVGAALIEGYNALVKDNSYVLLTKATNSKGEVTFLKTIVISNSPISLEEAAKVSLKSQNNFIKG